MHKPDTPVARYSENAAPPLPANGRVGGRPSLGLPPDPAAGSLPAKRTGFNTEGTGPRLRHPFARRRQLPGRHRACAAGLPLSPAPRKRRSLPLLRLPNKAALSPAPTQPAPKMEALRPTTPYRPPGLGAAFWRCRLQLSSRKAR